jgi:thiol-disulfide isomerase/thioredoxin
MMILIGVLFALGVLIFLRGEIMYIMAAFRVSVVWGLCVLFINPAALLFLIMHWAEAKRAFLIQLAGLTFVLGAGVIAGLTQPDGMDQWVSRAKAYTENSEAAGVLVSMTSLRQKEEEKSDTKQTSLLGMSLAEVRAKLGKPSGEMGGGGSISLLYKDFIVFAADGETVSEVAGTSATPKFHAKPARRGSAAGAPAPAIRTISKGGRQVGLGSILVPGKITIVDFYADWCGPCRAMSPRLEKAATDDPDVCLRKIDIVNWGTPVAKQHAINSIPHVVVYDKHCKKMGKLGGRNTLEALIARAR